jgi:AcrR family transcriptional regulator
MQGIVTSGYLKSDGLRQPNLVKKTCMPTVTTRPRLRTSRQRVRAENRRKQLIRLATNLFAKQGFGNTTTKQLAQQAGINESIVFRFFTSKEDLYWHVIENQIKLHGDRSWFLEALQSGGTDRQVFMTIAMETLHRDMNLLRLLLFSQLESHELSHRFFGTHLAPLYDALATYVQDGIRAGRFRKVDPVLAARFFIGGLAHHFQIQEIFSGRDYRDFNPRDVAESFVDVWLQGIRRRPESC